MENTDNINTYTTEDAYLLGFADETTSFPSFFLSPPDVNQNGLTWAFIRGYYDRWGDIVSRDRPTKVPNKILSCSISNKNGSTTVLQSIADFAKIAYIMDNDKLRYDGSNAIDFLGKLYEISGVYENWKYEVYLQWIDSKCAISRIFDFSREETSYVALPSCRVYKTHPDAIIPSKTNYSDVGYDITIIREEKKLLNNVTLYDTGIKFKLKCGYYGEIVPRSSLSKSGYILANSIGIIDNSYSGNIFIALMKVVEDAPEIKLPFRCCQLIIREQIHVDIIEVSEDFSETTRKEGGFGSTG